MTNQQSAPPVSDPASPQSVPAVPRTINLGSGKSFAFDCLNLDVDPYWGPDVVADFNQPFPGPDGGGAEFATERFGAVRLGPGMFDRIVARDVLEHIAELPVAMTNCLRLLRVGGVFDVSVPYELSLGAWSDPTHVRAFNERSWIYYCDWFWYLGWTEARFSVAKLDIEPSRFGQSLQVQGAGSEELLRTPRAVDAMHVQLVKVELTEQERAHAATMRGRG